jgi:hypothetical protein
MRFTGRLWKTRRATADCEQFGQIRANSTAFVAAQLAEERQVLTLGGYNITGS